MKIKLLFIGVIISLLLINVGCVEEDLGVKTALTEIRIGDLPSDDFDHIWINFSEIKLHRSGNNSGWYNISISKTIDLLYLHVNNLNETLGILEVDIGNYTKLWINVTNATGQLNSTKENVTIKIPSNILKIQQLFKLTQGNHTITIDIDLKSSIHKIGIEYKLFPVISRLEHRHKNKVKFKEDNPGQLKKMIENRPPVIDVVTNGSRGKPVSAIIGQSITFNASETFDIDDDNITYSWDFGDGTNAIGPVVNHSYDKQGSYWVVLSASDEVSQSTEIIEIHIKVKKQGS